MVKEFEDTGYWTLVLGGSSGLGLASALKLARHGMNICVVHRSTRAELPEIEDAFAQIRGLGVSFLSFNVDVTRPESCATVIDALKQQLNSTGRIRCLLHSIAKGNLKPMVDADANLMSQDFSLTIENMATSLAAWTQALHRAGVFADDARILSFTSEGSSRAWKHYAAVSAAKAALEAITRSIAVEYAPYGIRANCIQAGITDTSSFRKIPGSDTLEAFTLTRNPNHRMTTPQDVANVVYLLCKDEAAWINGVVLPVDGGEQIS